MQKRKGQWALLKREEIWEDGELYLKRLRILETPWFGIFLHKILISDKDRDLHDHPWSFMTIILRGGYREFHSRQLYRIRKPRSIICHSAEDFHRIELIQKQPATTLMFIGPKRKQWGFLTPKGWVHNQEYVYDNESVQ